MPWLAPWPQMNSKIFGKQSDSAVIVKLQTMPTCMVDGCTGADAIADRWRSHFECLYNSVTDQSAALQLVVYPELK